jgi:DNA-binding FrmR family transcriptional regulator
MNSLNKQVLTASNVEETCAECGSPHQHDENIHRLKIAEGHLRGIQRMLAEDTYCIDVIRQIQAVQSALNRVSANILEQHLNSCVITAVRGEDLAERERVLKELRDIYAAQPRT